MTLRGKAGGGALGETTATKVELVTNKSMGGGGEDGGGTKSGKIGSVPDITDSPRL